MSIERDFNKYSYIYYYNSITGKNSSFVPTRSPNPNGTNYYSLNCQSLTSNASSFSCTQIYKDTGYSNNNKVITVPIDSSKVGDRYIYTEFRFGGYATRITYYLQLNFEGDSNYYSLDAAHDKGYIDPMCLVQAWNHTSYSISSSNNFYLGTNIGVSGYPQHYVCFKPLKKLLNIRYYYSCTSIWPNGTSSGDGVYINSTGISKMSTSPIQIGPRIKIDGVWKDSVSYIKDNSVWKTNTPYIKINGVWKENI